MTEIAIGPHLLGRLPSPPDPRDWQLAPFLNADPLDAALLALQKSHAARATKAWAALVTDRLRQPIPPPSPAPPPPQPPEPQGDVFWKSLAALNQGDTPHCLGFGFAHFGTADPVNDPYTDADGHAIYYECKVIDGEPGAEDGSSVRSGAKAMQARKRIDAYAFAATVGEVIAWVRTKGPVVCGTDWHAAMFDPSPEGVVAPSGTVEGGHCYLCIGHEVATGYLWFQNSWGDGWGYHGRFCMKASDFATLLAADGEACAALELPL